MTGITFNIWAVLVLLGAGQGLFLSVFLLSRAENRGANKWLALLLAVTSLHLLEYAADISYITLSYPYLIAISYPLLFLMGPSYCFYCRRVLDREFRLKTKGWWHFVPAVLVLLLMLPFYLTPAQEKLAYLESLPADGNLSIPTGQLVFMGAHVLQTAFYTWMAYRFVARKAESFKTLSSDTLGLKKLAWLKSFSLYFLVYLVLYLLVVILLSTMNSFQVEIDYVILLLTSLFIFSIGYKSLAEPDILRMPAEPESKGPLPEKASSKFPDLKQRLLDYMEGDKPYLKSDLKISELADALQVPYYQLSQLINDEFSVNFYDFVNKYRVEDAKKLLREDEQNFKILAIAFEVGFNSKATFNRVFKKITGLTPSEFREDFSGAKA